MIGLRRNSTVSDHERASRIPSGPRLSRVDPWLMGVVLLIMGFGLVMVFSASAARAAHDTGNPYYYLVRQSVYLFLSLIAMYVGMRVPARVWMERGPMLLWFSLLLLMLVLIPGIGMTVNASRRWINLIVLRFQPSELFKFAILVFMAGYVLRKGRALESIRQGLLPVGAVLLIGGLLLLKEPDMGAFVVAVVIAGGILFLGGLPMRFVLGAGLIVSVLFALLAVAEPYRLARLTAFRDPWAHPFDTGFQLIQSLIAFGRGGVFGVGLGEGVQKMFYLPEAHTDFILAVIGEELGLVGVLGVIALFVFAAFRMFFVARRAEVQGRRFEALLCYGVLIWFSVQALASIGVNLGALPTKGLTLPLMSYGGSSLLFMTLAIGVVLGVSATLQPAENQAAATDSSDQFARRAS